MSPPQQSRHPCGGSAPPYTGCGLPPTARQLCIFFYLAQGSRGEDQPTDLILDQEPSGEQGATSPHNCLKSGTRTGHGATLHVLTSWGPCRKGRGQTHTLPQGTTGLGQGRKGRVCKQSFTLLSCFCQEYQLPMFWKVFIFFTFTFFFYFCFISFVFLPFDCVSVCVCTLGIEARTLCVLSIYSITELHPYLRVVCL